MNSVVPQLCYDDWWETLVSGCIEYVNGKNTTRSLVYRCHPQP